MNGCKSCDVITHLNNYARLCFHLFFFNCEHIFTRTETARVVQPCQTQNTQVKSILERVFSLHEIKTPGKDWPNIKTLLCCWYAVTFLLITIHQHVQDRFLQGEGGFECLWGLGDWNYRKWAELTQFFGLCKTTPTCYLIWRKKLEFSDDNSLTDIIYQKLCIILVLNFAQHSRCNTWWIKREQANG